MPTPITPRLIHASALIPPLWRFGREAGPEITSRLRFLPDGRILGSPSDNERFWRIEAAGLAILDKTKQSTTLFTTRTPGGGSFVLSGRYLRLFEGREVVHTLKPNLDDLQVEARLRGFERPLFISFNSHGRPYASGDTRWEFFKLPAEHDLNHVRISEPIDPHFWYVNKTARVLRLLSPLIAACSGRIVLAGMSSGGYAALLYGELLTRLYPARRIRTVSINPQSALDVEHARYFEQHIPREFWPAMIEQDALAQRDFALVDIRTLIGTEPHRRGDIRHVVHYDRGNPSEIYHVDRIAGLPGVDARPHDLGLGHADGIGAIVRSGAALDDILTA